MEMSCVHTGQYAHGTDGASVTKKLTYTMKQTSFTDPPYIETLTLSQEKA